MNYSQDSVEIAEFSIVLKEINTFVDDVLDVRLNCIFNRKCNNPYIDIFGLLDYCQKIAFVRVEELLNEILMDDEELYDYYEIKNYVRYMFNLIQNSIQFSLDNTLFITEINETQKEYLQFTSCLFNLFKDIFNNKYDYAMGIIDEDSYLSNYKVLLTRKEKCSNIFYSKYYLVNPDLLNDIDTVINVMY